MKGLAPDEGADGIQAGVEIECAHHRLQGGGEDGLPGSAAALVLPSAEPKSLGEVEPARPRREGTAGDELRPAPGQGADLLVRGGCPQKVGDHEAQDRVTEEGQALVVVRGGMLVSPGGMGQRLAQELPVEEAVAQPVLEAGERIGRRQPRYRRKARVAFVPPKPKPFDRATSTSARRATLGT